MQRTKDLQVKIYSITDKVRYSTMADNFKKFYKAQVKDGHFIAMFVKDKTILCSRKIYIKDLI